MTVAATLNQLAPSFGGQLLQPLDLAYEDARKVHNGLVDKRPAVIARCLGLADVVDAVKLARTTGLEVAVKGGGHNVAGKATLDEGLMIDLSLMKGIYVDPGARIARAQGGVLWRDFNRDTQVHGLATTGGFVGTTGIAGLTLGGGLGWLMTKHGLALDNLRSAEMVMADGRVLHVSHDENPDLFWAIRGGGGNFGIAASLEYTLHPVGPIVTGGLVAHPLQKGVEVLKFFREQCQSLPDEMMLVAGLLTGPDGATKLAGIVAGHFGSKEDGEAAVQPLKTFGPPVMDAMGPIPYCMLNGLLDASFPKGALNYWKAHFLSDLSDDSIEAIVGAFEKCPSPMSQIVIENFHGAATRVGLTDTACTLRTKGFNVVLISQWNNPRDTDVCTAWCRETYAALSPFLGATRYVNYTDDRDEASDIVSAVYGPNYARLRELKTKYDPENFFHTNVNIRPL